jgi:hypothetical protein
VLTRSATVGKGGLNQPCRNPGRWGRLLAVDPQLVSDVFGLGRAHGVSEPVARGELGEIRRLETDRGDWAIKRALEPGDEQANQVSTAYHRQCWEAGLPTPEPIRAVSGSFVTRVAGEDLRAYAWVDLDDPDRELDPVEVGELVAALHAVRQPGRTVSGSPPIPARGRRDAHLCHLGPLTTRCERAYEVREVTSAHWV